MEGGVAACPGQASRHRIPGQGSCRSGHAHSAASRRRTFEAEAPEHRCAVFGVLQHFHGHDVPKGRPNRNDHMAQKLPIHTRPSQRDVKPPDEENNAPVLGIAKAQVVWEPGAPRHLLAQLAAVIDADRADSIEHCCVQDLPGPDQKRTDREQRHARQADRPAQQIVADDSELEHFDHDPQMLGNHPVLSLSEIQSAFQGAVAHLLERLREVVNVSVQEALNAQQEERRNNEHRRPSGASAP
mmetsp:Transcript_44971/g.136354  ORF Transcript_44971/g.136354 Transcript_44971/m.136354 type:complete len:242 (-) Transcript_44971:69-794(-)